MIEDVRTVNFIMTPFSVSFDLPFRIEKGFTLRKAKPNGKELGKLLHYLKSINAFHGPTYGFDIYEKNAMGVDVIAIEGEKEKIEHKEFSARGIASGVVELTQGTDSIKYINTEWEYWIMISSPNVEWKDIDNMSDAFTISDYGLNVGLRCDDWGSFDIQINSKEPYNEYPLKLYYENGILKFRDYQKDVNLSKDSMEHIRDIYHLLKNHDEKKFGFITKSIEEYKNLLTIPRSSSLLLVGLFSLLELLLTHDDRNPSASRISWQLQKKIALLNNQFEKRIDFASHFNCSKDTKEETIIERLYQKRSLIAHGNQGDFSKDLQIINKGDEISFLRLLIRKTISYALKNPQIVSDLREC